MNFFFIFLFDFNFNFVRLIHFIYSFYSRIAIDYVFFPLSSMFRYIIYKNDLRILFLCKVIPSLGFFLWTSIVPVIFFSFFLDFEYQERHKNVFQKKAFSVSKCYVFHVLIQLSLVRLINDFS